MSNHYQGTMTRKRLLKHLLSPLIWLFLPLFCVATFLALVLCVMGMEEISKYPTMPFVAFIKWWEKLSES